jgi:hypothetical protein
MIFPLSFIKMKQKHVALQISPNPRRYAISTLCFWITGGFSKLEDGYDRAG